MNERIKALRKELKLSQSAFGKRLKVSRDVVNNMENGRVEIKDYMLKMIATEFNVREEWLRTGEGDMYTPTDDFLLDDVAKQYKLSKEQREMVRIIMGFPDEVRQDLAVALLAVCRELANKKERAPSGKDEARRKAIERELEMERAAKKETS